MFASHTDNRVFGQGRITLVRVAAMRSAHAIDKF